eukprot:TRINITY_DN9259_c0_g3_i2.p2 TRINITY_DN9259_c0_g3~~TRINITY_DN9259_c0_g3_i2.p2  ORF type:complete len:102 (+),score=18.93 TRINITY_DN9259_c0_g3_i2:81-386(+)
MYRAIPTGNRILEERWTRRQMAQHRQRIKSMKPIINTYHSVSVPNRTLRNFKREQIFEGSCVNSVDRCTEIERENRILLEKMTHIMQYRRLGARSLSSLCN